MPYFVRMDKKFEIRPVTSEDWPAVRELRLAALQDPAAPIAFLDTYESAAAQPDAFWQERTTGAAEGSRTARQFVAVGEDGEWGGTLVMLLEEAGSVDWAGAAVERRQGHVVGVFVRPEWRGDGVVIGALFHAGLGWAWSQEGLERVRLIVHEDNSRAQKVYQRLGFTPSGLVVPLEKAPEEREFEYVLDRPSGA